MQRGSYFNGVSAGFRCHWFDLSFLPVATYRAGKSAGIFVVDDAVVRRKAVALDVLVRLSGRDSKRRGPSPLRGSL
jgi:hypothetical protein